MVMVLFKCSSGTFLSVHVHFGGIVRLGYFFREINFTKIFVKMIHIINAFFQATTRNGDPGMCSSPHLTKIMYSPFSWTT